MSQLNLPTLEGRTNNVQVHLIDVPPIPSSFKILLGQGLKYIPPSPTSFSHICRNLSDAAHDLIHNSLRTKSTAPIPRFYVRRTKGTNPDLISWNTSATIRDFYLNSNIRLAYTRSWLTPFFAKIVKNSKRAAFNPLYKALQELKHETPFLIKPSDKNLGICIVSKTWYTNQVMKHLQSDTYEIFTGSLSTHVTKLKQLLSNLRQSSSLVRFILEHTTDARPAPFYVIPKIHKSPVSSRPITADHSSLCCNLSKVLCAAFNTIVERFPTILVSSLQLTNILDNTTYDNISTMITLDIESLYPNMSALHNRAMTAIIRKEFPEGYTVDGIHLNTQFLVDAFKFVLDNHFVSFNNVVYQQKQGVAMGTPMAPPFANLSLAYLENMVINTPHLLLYRRYIDDIFIIWNGEESDLDQFIAKLASTFQLKLNVTSKGHEVDFLDIHVNYTIGCNRLEYRTSQKVLNNYLYTPTRSLHPPHSLRGFIIGECKRYARTNSSCDSFVRLLRLFQKRLLSRGYQWKLITSTIGPSHEWAGLYHKLRHASPPQTQTQTQTETETTPDSRPYIVIPYVYRISTILAKTIIKKLGINARIAHRMMPNIASHLIRAELTQASSTQTVAVPPTTLCTASNASF